MTPCPKCKNILYPHCTQQGRDHWLAARFARRGRAGFFRWLERELKPLFPRLPERIRLFRLLAQHAPHTQRFLTQPTVSSVCGRPLGRVLALNYCTPNEKPAVQIRLGHPLGRGKATGAGSCHEGTRRQTRLVVQRTRTGCGQQCDTANVYGAAFHPLWKKSKSR
jgi:hypothetical protein